MLYLVRHAETRRTEALPRLWPLSERGFQQAAALSAAPFWMHVEAVYCSPEGKAVETIAPAAARRGLPLRLDVRLREVERPAVWYEEYEGAVQRFFSLPDPPEGWERRGDALDRVVSCLAEVEERHAGRPAAVCSHGLLLTLYLCGLKGSEADSFEVWRSIDFGAVAVVSRGRLMLPFGPPEAAPVPAD